MKNALLLSGGRTSGFMLRKKLDAGEIDDSWSVIFCNTGREMPQTLDFVRDMENRWGVEVVWLEYARVAATSLTPGIFPTDRRNQNLARSAARGESVHWFKRVNHETASRNAQPFDELLEWMTVLPNVISRGCSMQLKIRTAMRYLFSLGVKEYRAHIGIRKDEEHRAIQILANCDSYEHPQFPLVEGGFTEADVLRFWSDNDFDLRLKSYQGNCDMCFLKAKWKRVLMAQQNPGMIDWWVSWETKRGGLTNGRGGIFRRGEPYTLIAELAKQPTEKIRAQIEAETSEDIPCSCAERAFGPEEDESE